MKAARTRPGARRRPPHPARGTPVDLSRLGPWPTGGEWTARVLLAFAVAVGWVALRLDGLRRGWR